MNWRVGAATIEDLLKRGDLSQVPADSRLAERLLGDASRHLESAQHARQAHDLAGAYQLAYDALRKSGAALLAVQGLRGTSRGGHVAIQEAVAAQFGGAGSPFKSFGRIRRNRNNFEYPDADTAPAHEDDVQDAFEVAAEAFRVTTSILGTGQLTPWT